MRNLYLLLFLIFISCSTSNPSRKDKEYSADQEGDLLIENTCKGRNFEFKLGSQSHTINFATPEGAAGEWFTIYYPNYEASIYCTYLPITPESLHDAYEDTRRMLYSHMLVAEGLEEEKLKNADGTSQGIIFTFKGQVATPIQFFVTDSLNHFLKGSLYYEKPVRLDTLEASTNTLRNDIKKLIETLTWNIVSD